MKTPNAVVALTALCVRSGEKLPVELTIEEQMPVGPILGAATLDDAVEYFLSNTDTVCDIIEVRSFKVNGRELLHTFVGHRTN